MSTSLPSPILGELEQWSTTEEGQFFERKSAFHRDPRNKRPRNAREIAWDVVETLAAMANADGGEMIVGLEDDGTVTGVPLPENRFARDSHPQGL